MTRRRSSGSSTRTCPLMGERARAFRNYSPAGMVVPRVACRIPVVDVVTFVPGIQFFSMYLWFYLILTSIFGKRDRFFYSSI